MNILIVEDDDPAAITLMRAMERWGQEAVRVASGKAAVLAVQRRHFDVALMDIRLPDGFGYEYIPIIKRILPEINIITMTGDNTPELERSVRETGITYYMAKPVNLEELKRIIDHFVSKKIKEETLS